MKLFSGMFENPKVFELEISLSILEKDATKNSYLYNNLLMTRILSKAIRSKSKLKDACSKYEIEEKIFIKLLRKFCCFQNLTWKQEPNQIFPDNSKFLDVASKVRKNSYRNELDFCIYHRNCSSMKASRHLSCCNLRCRLNINIWDTHIPSNER